MPVTLEAIAAKVSAGERLTESDALDLASTADIIGLGMLADEARRRRHGDRVTFLRVSHVTWADAASALPFPDATGEVRLEGTPPSMDEATGALRSVAERAGSIPVAAFSVAELQGLAQRAGLSLDLCLARLKDVGLERVSEASLDDPGFEPAFETVARAGIEISRVGFEHAGDDWLHQIQRLVPIQEASRSVRVLSPLPRRPNSTAPTTGYEDLKRVAMARLIAVNVETIQVDWSVYGPKLAQVALTFGADDLDDVPASDDLSLGARRAPLEEVRRNIQAAALVPVERNGRWELIG